MSIAALADSGKAHRFGKDRWVSDSHLDGLKNQLLNALSTFHEKQPLRQALSRAELRSLIRTPVDRNLFDQTVTLLIEEKRLHADRDRFRLMEHRATLSPELSEIKSRIEASLLESPFSPPGTKELIKTFGKSSESILAYMIESGELIRLEEGIALHRKALETAESKIRDFLEKNGKATVSDLKSYLGTSRKFAVPLLVYFDSRGLTEREGDFRKLR